MIAVPAHATITAMTGVTMRELVERKRDEIARARAATTLTELEAMVAQADPPRNFFAAVTRHPHPGHMTVIAQVKRSAPGGSPWRPEYEGNAFRPGDIARRYHAAGAAAVSVATDTHYGGGLAMIEEVRSAQPLPVLRGDLILDPWQLWESRAAGADAVVLPAAYLNESEIVDLLILAQQLRLTTVLEAHDMETLLRVRPHVGFPHSGYGLLGINNRDPVTMAADVRHTLRLADMAEDRSILVSASGIRGRHDMDRLSQAGVRIVHVGEHLMRHHDPGAALEELTRWRLASA